MIVEELFSKIPFAEVLSKPAMNISGVAVHSNLVEPGDLFIPLIGENYNGYRFVSHALQKGAAAVAGEEIRSRKNHLASIYLPNAEKHLPYICSAVYGNPSKMLNVIGVTGTSGKTVTCSLIEAMIRDVQRKKVGFLGSTGYRWGTSHQEALLTTPSAPQLQRFFRKMVDGQVESVVVECSSHGIEQHRLDNTHFDIALFTNLTHDHMDYHGSFVSYRNAKWKLFSKLLDESEKRKKYAIFNIDDPTGRSWARESLYSTDVITYSIEPATRATIALENLKHMNDGTEVKIRAGDATYHFKTPMMGTFNLQNIVSAFAVGYAMKLDLNKAAEVFSKGVYISGRLEKIVDTKDINVFVDFAHSEDALSRVLDVMNRIKKTKIITVFGCGGERDKIKRPKMGKVAVEKSDVVIVTSDNPRNESPEAILDDIFSGIDQQHFSNKEIFKVVKREEAIDQALRMAKKDDIVLIAGKGHESYQIIGNFKHPFDDRRAVKEWMKKNESRTSN